MSPCQIILYLIILAGGLHTPTSAASPGAATITPIASVDSCPVKYSTTISFHPGRTTLTKSAKSLLRQAVPIALSCDSCKIRLIVSEQVSCFPANRKEGKKNLIGWDRAAHIGDFLCNTLHVPSDQIILTFSENDTSNEVVLNYVTASEWPGSVPAPHPDLRRH